MLYDEGMYTYDEARAQSVVLKNIIPIRDPQRIPEEFPPGTYEKEQV